MSAIGGWTRMTAANLDRCLALAAGVRQETKRRLLGTKTVTVGLSEFHDAWSAATLEEVDFDYSGYVLAQYFLAQGAINGFADPFDTADAQALSKVFTGAFPVRSRTTTFPPLPPDELRRFCAEEYRGDADGMVEAIAAADAFFRRGIESIGEGEAVVFSIS